MFSAQLTARSPPAQPVLLWMDFSTMHGSHGIVSPFSYHRSALFISAKLSIIFAVMWRTVHLTLGDGSSKRGLYQGESFISRRTRSTGNVGKESTARHWQSCKSESEGEPDVYVRITDRSISSVAAFMGDSDFPKSALPYFKGGRIVLWQSLYHMYSKLAFTKATDRCMALLGLEKRLGREFQTTAEFGIMEEYLERSLLWQRDKNGGMLTRVPYPQDRFVPSWSWMAYVGAIGYLDVPLKETDWCKGDLQNPFGGGSLRQTQAQGKAELKAVAKGLSITMVELLTRVVFDDEREMINQGELKCVVIGQEKAETEAKPDRIHYVLVIKPSPRCVCDCYERVGVGRLLARHISDDPWAWVTIR